VTQCGGGCIVRLLGEHDVSTVGELSATMVRAVDLDDDVVLDLSEVEFMAAATVSIILRTRELLHRRSKSLSVRSPSRVARRVLELCRVEDLIEPGGVEVVATTDLSTRPIRGRRPWTGLCAVPLR